MKAGPAPTIVAWYALRPGAHPRQDVLELPRRFGVDAGGAFWALYEHSALSFASREELLAAFGLLEADLLPP
jgi:hypothetical protein